MTKPAGRLVRHLRPIAVAAAAVCLSSAGVPPVGAAPALTISPEYPVSDPVFGSASVDAGYPAAAALGATTLVVWEELDAIVGARVSGQGSVLDPAGIAVGPDGGLRPDVAAGPGQDLVAWSSSSGIQAARVATDGSVLDPTAIQVRTALVDAPGVGVAFDGTNYLVVWSEFHAATNDDVYAARVSPSGQVLDPSPIALSTGTTVARHPGVAFDGTNYLATWEEGTATMDVEAARIAPTGTVLGTVMVSGAPNDQTDPVVAWGGTEYLVAWSDARQGGTRDLYAARVSSGGTVLDADGIAVSAASGDQTMPAVDFDGTNFLTAWDDTRDGDHHVYAARLSPGGVVLDPAGLAVATTIPMAHPAPAVVWTGSSHLAVFGSAATGTAWGDVLARRITQRGAASATPVISLGANSQLVPGVASDGTNQLAAWVDRRSDTSGNIVTAVYGGRVSRTGQILDGGGLRLSSALGSSAASADVAFNGTNYLVVWNETAGVMGRRVAPDGTILDPVPLRIGRADGVVLAPSVASNGTNWSVAWFHQPAAGSPEIRSAVVRPDGIVTARILVSSSVDTISGVDVGAGAPGGGYLVAWTAPPGPTGPDMVGARLSPTGQLMDPTAIVISAAAAPQTYPSVSNGSDPYLVTWEDYRNFVPNEYDIYGARVGSDGTVLDPAGIAVGPGATPDTEPSTTWDGTNWLIPWLRTANTDRIMGVLVAPDGSVLGAAFTIALSAHTGSLAATMIVPGTVAVTYSWLTPGPPNNAIRMFLRVVTE